MNWWRTLAAMNKGDAIVVKHCDVRAKSIRNKVAYHMVRAKRTFRLEEDFEQKETRIVCIACAEDMLGAIFPE